MCAVCSELRRRLFCWRAGGVSAFAVSGEHAVAGCDGGMLWSMGMGGKTLWQCGAQLGRAESIAHHRPVQHGEGAPR